MTCEFILKRILLSCLSRHQLLSDDELGPLYDLLIDEPPMIRRAIGELVYDHLIAQKGKNFQLGHILFINWPIRTYIHTYILCGYLVNLIQDSLICQLYIQVEITSLPRFIWEECYKFYENFLMIQS